MAMRATVTTDRTLYRKELAMSDPDMPNTDIRKALKTYVRTRTAKRLAPLVSAMHEMSGGPHQAGRAMSTPISTSV